MVVLMRYNSELVNIWNDVKMSVVLVRVSSLGVQNIKRGWGEWINWCAVPS